MKALQKLLLLAAVLAFVTACGGSKTVKQDPIPQMPSKPIQEWKAPEWVMKGSGAFEGERGKVFYGVGVSSESKNYATLWETANVRARHEVGTVFEVYIESLTKDYLSSITKGSPDAASEEALWERAIKQVTSITISGVEIVDHWQHPETRAMFSLARLDINAFKDYADKAKELNERAKAYIRQNSDRLFNELEKEVAKKQAQQPAAAN
jgi:hypothetical protein